jgi:hypothetical protein
MTLEHMDPTNPRLVAALVELQALITARYPSAVFSVARGGDPDGVYLTATVDVEDIDEVVDALIDRMATMQIEEGLPVYVPPARPPDRVVAMLGGRQPARPAAALAR